MRPLRLLACLLSLAPGVARSGGLRTAHFDLQPTARAEGTARDLSQRIEAVRGEFEAFLGRGWPGVTEVRIGVGRAEFEALCPERPPAWAAAVAFPERHLVVLEARELLGPGGELTLRHELIHAALGELGGPWPRWFHEGLAMRLSGENLGMAQYSALFRGVTQDRLFHFEDLASRWPEQPPDVEIAYAQSASFVGYLADRHGPARFGELLAHVQAGDSFEKAFGKAFHAPLDGEERDWRQTLPARYSWLPIVTGEGMLWFVVACVCVLAYVRRRRGRAQWEAEQALLEHAQGTGDDEGPFWEPPEDPPGPLLH